MIHLKKKRLLMISYPFPPNASAGAVRSERFARYLHEIGWEIDVITIPSRKDMFKDSERVNQLIAEGISIYQTSVFDPWLLVRDTHPRFFLLRVFRSVVMKITNFPDHMVFWIPSVIFQGLKIYSKKKYDVIYTTSPPHSSHLSGLILSILTGRPWVSDFRDPWTLNALHHKTGRSQFMKKIENWCERNVLKYSSIILANTRSNRKNTLSAFPFLPFRKVVYVPNAWEDFFHQADTRKYSKKLKEPFTIVHAGNFYPHFKPYALLEAIKTWQQGNQPEGVPELGNQIRIIILGAKDMPTAEKIAALKLGGFVEIVPWVSQSEAREIMCNADLLWATLGTGKESATYVPSKLFEYISARVPIIGFFPEGDACALIRETKTGVVFNNDDPNPVILYLNKLINLDRDSFFDPDLKRIERYNIKTIIKKLNTVLNECISI